MQFARFVETFGLYLGLTVAGLVAGCGGDSQHGTSPKVNAEGITIKEERRQEQLDLRAERKAAAGGNVKRGKNRGPTKR